MRNKVKIVSYKVTILSYKVTIMRNSHNCKSQLCEIIVRYNYDCEKLTIVRQMCNYE